MLSKLSAEKRGSGAVPGGFLIGVDCIIFGIWLLANEIIPNEAIGELRPCQVRPTIPKLDVLLGQLGGYHAVAVHIADLLKGWVCILHNLLAESGYFRNHVLINSTILSLSASLTMAMTIRERTNKPMANSMMII